MSEIEQLWAQKLSEAAAAARESGRHDIADYLDLKAQNDALRQAGVGVLFDTLIHIADEIAPRSSALTIDREEPHSFPYRGANISGTLLTFRLGVRCLQVEAGWTRTPGDGFIRGGALAVARLIHFGFARMNAELSLKANEDGLSWTFIDPDGREADVDDLYLKRHISVLHG